MKRILILFSLFIGLGSIPAYSQTISDAIRYSYLTYSSSARNAGVNNSIGAFGSDFGSIAQNPSGLGWYRSSELSLGLSMTNYNTDARLQGDNNQSLSSKEFKFGIPSLGMVFNRQPVASSWKQLNFGIGFNTLTSFRQGVDFNGTSPGSIMNHFTDQSNGLSPDQLDAFSTGLAYDAFGTFLADSNNLVYGSDINPDLPVYKSQSILTTGSYSEMTLAFAGNYDEKLTLGASIGIPVFNFNSRKVYKEEDLPGTVEYFNSLRFEENLDATGVGINLKLGATFKPVQPLRIGLAIHTPTALSISEEYVNSFVYNFDTQAGDVIQSPVGKYDYTLVTPWRMIGNVGVLVGTFGFLSAEAEYVDYTTAAFNFKNTGDDPSAQSYEAELNREIETNLKAGVNFRFGGEVAIGDFRLRAGYGLLATPYKSNTDFNKSYSAGLGARIDKFFFDLGYIHSEQKQSYLPYVVSANNNQPVVDTQLDVNKFILTVGMRF